PVAFRGSKAFCRICAMARGLRRNPAFSLTAIFIVAVGIGATSAVFSAVDRLLFRNLPYPNSDRLVSVGISNPLLDGEFLVSNDCFHLRDEQTPFETLTSWRGIADCDLAEENPLRLSLARQWNRPSSRLLESSRFWAETLLERKTAWRRTRS